MTVNADHSAKHIIYADDRSLLFSRSSGADLSPHANRTLPLVITWAEKIELKLTIEQKKTKALTFHPRNKMYALQSNPYRYKGSEKFQAA